MSPKRPKPKTKPKAGTNQAAAKARKSAFAAAYVANGRNGTQAAIEAGYSAKTAATASSRLLNDVQVKAEIEQHLNNLRAKAEAEHGVSVETLLRNAAAAVFLDPGTLFDAKGRMLKVAAWPLALRLCIDSIELENGRPVKVKFTSRSTARDQAARMIGAYEKDNRQVNDPIAQLVAAIQSQRSAFPIVPE